MSGYTQGPYEIADFPPDSLGNQNYLYVKKGDLIIAKVATSRTNGPSYEEALFNARLIAAAPDLTKAAKWAVGLAVNEMLSVQRSGLDPAAKKICMEGWMRIKKECSDAIAKAEGINESKP